jgi:hypothetical protein
MPLTPYMCGNCGFWQKYFAAPPFCPVCSDVRNALPEDGWDFKQPEELASQTTCTWEQVTPEVVMFSNTPRLGIGSSGYLILHPEGNIAFEAAGWYSQRALDEISRLGGIRYLSCSHPHGMGALYQLQDYFKPRYCVIQRDGVRFTKAFRVNYPFDDSLDLYEGITLHHVAGHYEGHSVLHHKTGRLLFAGDSLKFDLDEQGKAYAVSCHKAFHNQIPLSHAEVRRYREVIGKLDFTQVFTPFEHVPNVTGQDAVCLFDRHLNGVPFVHPIHLDSCK